jgi:hypothetical protein
LQGQTLLNQRLLGVRRCLFDEWLPQCNFQHFKLEELPFAIMIDSWLIVGIGMRARVRFRVQDYARRTNQKFTLVAKQEAMEMLMRMIVMTSIVTNLWRNGFLWIDWTNFFVMELHLTFIFVSSSSWCVADATCLFFYAPQLCKWFPCLKGGIVFAVSMLHLKCVSWMLWVFLLLHSRYYVISAKHYFPSFALLIPCFLLVCLFFNLTYQIPIIQAPWFFHSALESHTKEAPLL